MKAWILVFLAGAACAQDMSPVPASDISVYGGHGFWSRFARNYLPAPVTGTSFANSNRLDQLMRAGNVYLSLQDAVALALENNLDIEYHRYDRREADTDVLRASGGRLLQFQSSGIRSGFSSASSGVLAGSAGLGSAGSGSGSGQSGILSGFTITAAGSGIPNIDPVAFVSWQATHQTRVLTTNLNVGTNYLVSTAHNINYGVQKGFWTGATVTMDMSQQSLFQNSPANQYNPSLSGNLELNITQPLLQGFGLAVNRRNVSIAQNNLKVADLNFKEQVMATVKNVIDLYWDLVTLRNNLRTKQQSLDLAQKLHEDNRKRMAAGAIAPIDIIQAEAGVQTARLDLRQAQNQLLQQELIVKSALTRSGVDSVAIMDAHVIPTDSIVVPETEVIQPIQDMVAEALSNRPEPQETRLNMANSRLQLKGVKNELLPNLSVFVDLQNTGFSGAINTLPIPTTPDGEPLFARVPTDPFFLGNWGGVFAQVLSRNFPTYTAGFNFSVALHNTTARADMVKNQLDYRRLEIDAKQQENAIRLNVVNARISLEQARAAFETAAKARLLTVQTFDGTQKKYLAGKATFTEVEVGQRDVVTAEAAEISALNSYIKARTNLDMVLGRILEANRVDLGEAYQGKVSRPPGPIPELDPNGGAGRLKQVP